jgi:hypothetical protein
MIDDALVIGGLLLALAFVALIDWRLVGVVAGLTVAIVGFVRAG